MQSQNILHCSLNCVPEALITFPYILLLSPFKGFCKLVILAILISCWFLLPERIIFTEYVPEDGLLPSFFSTVIEVLLTDNTQALTFEEPFNSSSSPGAK